MDQSKPQAIKLHLEAEPLFSRVWISGVENKNAYDVQVGFNADRMVTTIQFKVDQVPDEPIQMEGYFVSKELADLYGSPDEIARLKYEAGIYRDLRDGKTYLVNGYGEKRVGVGAER